MNSSKGAGTKHLLVTHKSEIDSATVAAMGRSGIPAAHQTHALMAHTVHWCLRQCCSLCCVQAIGLPSCRSTAPTLVMHPYRRTTDHCKCSQSSGVMAFLRQVFTARKTPTCTDCYLLHVQSTLLHVPISCCAHMWISHEVLQDRQSGLQAATA